MGPPSAWELRQPRKVSDSITPSDKGNIHPSLNKVFNDKFWFYMLYHYWLERIYLEIYPDLLIYVTKKICEFDDTKLETY